MDKDTKITYITISILIIILGGIAYFLQDTGIISEQPTKEATNTTTLKKATTPSIPSPATTSVATTSPTSSTTTMGPTEKITRAILTTNKGIIEFSFATNTPLAVKSFVTLAQSKFYDGVRFHRVIKGFMIQTGDPLSKDIKEIAAWGTGGPTYRFKDELTGKEQYTLGTVAMANSGPNTNGSQFFIVTANPGYPLPPNYTVFGKVTKGLDVALKIDGVATTGSPSDRPLEDVIIEKIEVME